MGKLRTLAAALLAITTLSPALSAQEQGTVTGRVTAAEDGAPISGAQVVVQGTSRRTVTDASGNYRLSSLAAGSHIINVSVLGRASGTRTVTLAAGATAQANFQLRASVVALEGVVVNAITGQAERRREAGTNVANIDVDALASGPVTNIAQVLTGRTAGVNMQGASGTSGTSQRIRIRGANSLSLSNEPLIFLDGVQFSNSKGGIAVGGQDYSRLNDLNPNDIENIEVLKGPAASALYGTAAANGVLLITTKRGRSGPPQFRVYSEYGSLSDETDYPATWMSYQILNPNASTYFDEYGYLIQPEIYGSAAAVARFCDNERAAGGNPNSAADNCTQDATISFNALRDPRTTPFSTGNRTRFGVNVSGGSANTTYYVSVDREEETGVIDFNTLEKFNFRTNINAVLSDRMTVQVNAGYTDSYLVLNQNDNNIFSPLINGLLYTALYPSGANEINAGPYDPSVGRAGPGFGFTNEDISKLVTNQANDRFILGANATARPFSWLSANANVGLDFFSRFDFETLQPGVLPIAASYANGYRFAIRSNSYLYTANSSATGTFNLSDDLVATSTAGASYQRNHFNDLSCYGEGLLTTLRSCGATSSAFDIDENFSEVRTIGAFFQQEFAWRDRLFLAASLRGDDNSAFGTNFGFITYPSASLSWVMSEEPFFPSTGAVSNLRLRAAYGTSGLRPNFRDAITLLGPVAVRNLDEEQTAVVVSSTGNVDLEPERTTEFELGFDAGFFNDRVSVDFTHFTKESTDALISRDLPPSAGLAGSQFQNLGSIRNWGNELGLSALLVDRGNVRFNMRVSATTLDNEVVELGEGIGTLTFNRGQQAHREGFPTGAFFAKPYNICNENGDGLIQRTEVCVDSSQFIQADDDGDGVMETIPVAFIGNSLPTNSQSLSGELTLFQWLTVSSLFERRAGFYQLNDTERFRCDTGLANQGFLGQCRGAADPTAPLDLQARIVASRFHGTRAGYIEKGDFIKWRELSVRLGVPPALRAMRALEGASLTLSGRNLMTWTDYTGLDPEINETGGGSNFTQGEFNTQPPVRVFTIRLDLAL